MQVSQGNSLNCSQRNDAGNAVIRLASALPPVTRPLDCDEHMGHGIDCTTHRPAEPQCLPMYCQVFLTGPHTPFVVTQTFPRCSKQLGGLDSSYKGYLQGAPFEVPPSSPFCTIERDIIDRNWLTPLAILTPSAYLAILHTIHFHHPRGRVSTIPHHGKHR